MYYSKFMLYGHSVQVGFVSHKCCPESSGAEKVVDIFGSKLTLERKTNFLELE